MIAYLRGRKLALDSETIVVDVQGVGYDVHCSGITLSEVHDLEDIELYIYTAVREDAITLYGFRTPIEKQLFLTLIKVNGVGPKMAIGILSGASVERILNMIEAEDVKALTQLPKVGKKTAEQLILSLKGKLPKLDSHLTNMKTNTFMGTRSEIVSALVNLGFRLQEVEHVVNDMKSDVEVEDGIRKGLQLLSQV